MKVKASVRKLCKSCKLIKRKGILYMICHSSPRHKRRQG